MAAIKFKVNGSRPGSNPQKHWRVGPIAKHYRICSRLTLQLGQGGAGARGGEERLSRRDAWPGCRKRKERGCAGVPHAQEEKLRQRDAGLGCRMRAAGARGEAGLGRC